MKSIVEQILLPKEGNRRRKKNSTNQMNFRSALSRLDGIGSYNGIMFVATTNHIDSLDPVIYRRGRLDPFFFDYVRKKDIIKKNKKSFEVKLSKRQIENLPDRNNKITPSTMRKYTQDHEKNLPGLLSKMKKLI